MTDQLPPDTPLLLKVNKGTVPSFTTLLQSGFTIETEPQKTISELLLELPGFTEDYVDERLQTIFLNGMPLDDVSSPVGSGKSVLALAGHMPGLAGAILKRGSVHAPLRSQVSVADSSSPDEGNEPGLVRIKLFGIVAKERGAEILNGGARMNSKKLAAFFRNRPELLAKIISAQLADQQVEIQSLAETLSSMPELNLTIND